MVIRGIKRRLFAFLLCISILFTTMPVSVLANEIGENNEIEVPKGTGTGAANIKTVDDIVAQIKFANKSNGHSFAAEQGNNYIDRIKGNNAIITGDDNIKNGADRVIFNQDGTKVNIQTKYYKNATNTINSCFDENTGMFRYYDENGIPMQIEVPKDQYDAAIKQMENKILEGKVPGVTDPSEAELYVRKGNITYKQSVNLAKAGTVESLTYDAAHGVVSATVAFGISTLLNYAVCRLNGQDEDDALKTSVREGVRVGELSFATAVIASQLTKTGIMNVFKPSSEAIADALGEEYSRRLLEAFGQKALADSGSETAMTITKQAAGILRAQVLISVVTIIVFSIPDAKDCFEKRISRKQFVKNFAITAISVVASAAGYMAGALIIGNVVVPGIGTIPGVVVGIILSLAAGWGGGIATDKLLSYVTEDDADEMYRILEKEFAQLCEDYMVNESEMENIVDEFSNTLGSYNSDVFKDMYQSEDREQYAVNILEPLFEKEVAKRAKISAPTEEELRMALKEELQGVVFVH